MRASPLGLLFALTLTISAGAAEFDVTAYGAKPNDDLDDTKAIIAALTACGQAGGGTVLVPEGTFLVARQSTESPILEIPSKTVFQGKGEKSVLKFTAAVNQQNFWRMLGASKDGHDITIRDLHLDGSTTATEYIKGQTPEQTHGIFFYKKGGQIENVTIERCLIENFCGDCIAFSQGCRHFTVRDVTVRNFIRQGIQIGGGPGDGGHLITNCRDLEHTVKPGGSTIHVEHAEGASDIRIEGNRCRNNLLAGGGAEKLSVRENEIDGRIEGNGLKQGLIEKNRLRVLPSGKAASMQFGYAKGLVIRGNTIEGGASEATGIYVWGASKYNPEPSRDIIIEQNTLELKGQPIALNGVNGGRVQGNKIIGSSAPQPVDAKRTEGVEIGANP